MKLSTTMRRLLTGYAVWHNRRHDRVGHLFQNRYKSVVVEEDPYFLELVRYIHLNPVRSRQIISISELDAYPYTGHSVLLGNRRFNGQNVDWVLSWFGKTVGEARRHYRSFIKAGLDQGPREEFRGGGLIRSIGGKENLVNLPEGERTLGDERILGKGVFVEDILRSEIELSAHPKKEVHDILEEVCTKWKISPSCLLSQRRDRLTSKARREFLFRAHEEAAQSLNSLGLLCGMAHTSVRKAVEKARSDSGHGNI